MFKFLLANNVLVFRNTIIFNLLYIYFKSEKNLPFETDRFFQFNTKLFLEKDQFTEII